MNVTSLLRRRTVWRWGVPVAAVAAIAVVASGILSAGASPSLPDLDAAQLLAGTEQAQVQGFSGQVVANADLGLPALPDLGGDSGSTTSLYSMLSGSHTARIWYAGPTKQRFALLGTLGETDVFHDGTDLWQWDSSTLSAVHTTLPTSAADKVPTPVQSSSLTPDQLAQRAMSAIDPSTIVTTDQSRTIAGRAAYDLVLSPKDTTSRVGSVRIGIDAQYKLPLSVQVFPRGDATHAAIDVSFTSIDFSVPANSEFAFKPPSSAKVTQQDWSAATAATAPGKSGQISSAAKSAARVLGTGWTSVIVLPAPSQLPALGGALTPVSGTWGTGRLFSSKLVSALLVDDGRMFVGAVDPSVLYAAAGQK